VGETTRLKLACSFARGLKMKKSSKTTSAEKQLSNQDAVSMLFFAFLITFANMYLVWCPLWIAGRYRNFIEPSGFTFFNNIGGLIVAFGWLLRKGVPFQFRTRLKIYIPVGLFFGFSMISTLVSANTVYKDYFRVYTVEALVTVGLHVTGLFCAIGTDFWLHLLSKMGNRFFKSWPEFLEGENK
jgi:hypothetical protein